MSLNLLEAVKHHKIAHQPEATLKLRIGIHTGINIYSFCNNFELYYLFVNYFNILIINLKYY